MNLYLLTWSKCKSLVKLERGASTDTTANSLMLTNIVVDFSKDRKTYLNLNGDLQT